MTMEPEEVALEPRVVKAPNRGPFTLDGTRSFLVGRDRAVVIDAGPDVESHVRALSSALRDVSQVSILLTHGHGDHAGAARSLGEELGATVFGSPSTSFSPLREGDRIPTDEGDLLVLSASGHTRDHLVFHWPEARALFAGDVLLGRGSTTWLGEYPGCVADYLETLRKVEGLGLDVIYPAHGSPIRNPAETLAKFRGHRLDRLRSLAEKRRKTSAASLDDLMQAVYGGKLPPRLVKAARSSIEVMLYHLDTVGEPS